MVEERWEGQEKSITIKNIKISTGIYQKKQVSDPAFA
jgi:hypothetical protein